MKLYPKLIGAAVVFVIIGMPMISYMYLRQGLTFRMDSIAALKQSDKEVELTKKLSKIIDIEEGMVNACLNSDKIDITKLDMLYDKYRGHKHFFLTTYSGNSESPSIKTLGEKHRIEKVSESELNSIENLEMLLVDTSGQVRETYVYDEEVFKTFVQNLSVLLPVEESKKIKLDR